MLHRSLLWPQNTWAYLLWQCCFRTIRTSTCLYPMSHINEIMPKGGPKGLVLDFSIAFFPNRKSDNYNECESFAFASAAGFLLNFSGSVVGGKNLPSCSLSLYSQLYQTNNCTSILVGFMYIICFYLAYFKITYASRICVKRYVT